MKFNTIITKYNSVVFDLDNTLYDEKIYLLEAFKNISLKLCNSKNQYLQYYDFLMSEFKLNGRDNLYSKFLINFNLPNNILSKILQIHRSTIIPLGIEINPVMYDLITKLMLHNLHYYIITNGNVDQQKNKIQQIKWKCLSEPKEIVFANNIEPKPSPESYYYLKNIYKLGKTLYIGDAITDKEFSENSSIDFIFVNEIIN
jgi:putative hydrolase of the HAD superfamily